MTHSPAEIVRRLLVSLGLGAEPASGAVWPVYAESEPDDPDSVVTVYDTTGVSDGRMMTSGEVNRHHGVQVRVRSGDPRVASAKARAIQASMETDVYQEEISFDGAAYLVHCFSRIGPVLPLGPESPTSRRNLFTVNALVTIGQLD